ncbi:MAG: B12-binding domain-containing radical SAM protein [Deltaproteobacteria bacterium]|nr:B12-binding domain-containing radical SAM protein [Deltaproteobacteria bacterium]
MKALLVYPSYPDTFWSFKHALRFVRTKAAFPPLGLLTVASLMPADWDKKVVDLNVEPLTDQHLAWADMVFISAMVVQSVSTREVLDRCHAAGKPVVGGGPYFTRLHDEISGVDHVIAGEAEDVMAEFLADLAAGQAKPLYQAASHPELSRTPEPSWELINLGDYRTMPVQFSRGCPFDCDFCDVVALFGRRPRLKSPAQVVGELEHLYRLGWRGPVMMVDDNFIGHKSRTKELLRHMVAWQKERRGPYSFLTQASVNLADDPEMLSLMAQAKFSQVFLGLETPSLSSLQECNKHQNQGRDLVEAVKTIQSYGLEVMGGFIVGFDADPPSIFRDQVSFIRQAAIPTAMVGMLSLMPGTRLYDRMNGQNRILGLPSGDNAMDGGALNFLPKMGVDQLIEGYKYVLNCLYEPKAYYQRALSYLRRSGRALHVKKLPHTRVKWADLVAGARIIWRLGFLERGRLAFWTFLARVGFTRPAKIPVAMAFAATGFHLRKVTLRFIKSVSPAIGGDAATPPGEGSAPAGC